MERLDFVASRYLDALDAWDMPGDHRFMRVLLRPRAEARL